MKIFVLLLCLYFTQLSAFQSFKILDESNKISVLSEPAYFLGELTTQDAYEKFKHKEFKPFNEESKSLGFHNTSLWIGVELVNKSDEKTFLSLINTSLERVELFTYKDDALIATAKSGILIQKEKKDLDSFEPRFKLNVVGSPVIYLLKINSLSPLIAPVYIGEEAVLMHMQLPGIILFSIFTGVVFSLFYYNLFLYFSTKERDYALYTGYIFFIFILIVYMREYLHFWPGLSSSSDMIFEIFSLEGVSLFLLLFTLKFFNIQRSAPKLYKTSLTVGITASTLYLVTPYISSIGQVINILILATINILSLYIGLINYFKEYAPSKYFLLALCGSLIGSFIFVGMINGFLSYNVFTDSAMLAGTAWEVIFFSLALGYKIKLLHIERNEAISKLKVQEKMLFLQSRQASVGELVGNIAHQWREPIAEIGSIQTNLKATLLFKGGIAKEKLLNSIEQSYNILRHLSDTIDIFYRFFRHKSSDKEEFSINEEIINIQKMVHYSLEVENITLKYDSQTNISVFGDKGEFSNALLNIVLNAKDVLVDRKIVKPTIYIRSYRSGNSIIITIEDNAGGIKQDPVNKIFEISISSKAESIGIGLYIAKSIIEQRMRGKLSVKNGINGAIFTIMLPLHSEIIDVEDESELYDIEESALKKIDRLEKQVARSVELEKALAQWEDIFNQAHWGIAVHKGSSDSFEMVNPAFCKMHGYTEKELKNKNVYELFSDENLEQLREMQKEAFNKGFVSFEAIHLRKDGSKFPVNIDITVVKNESSEILYHIENVRDITEQKKANARLLLKKFAVDHINESIYLADEKGNFYYVNDGACRSLGYTQEEMLKLSVGDIDPDWPAERWPENWEFLKEHKTATMQLRHKRKDGTIFPVEIVANYFVYEGVPYIMGFARDISERIEMEKRKADEKMRLFFERQLVGMAITSPEKGWLRVNDKLCAMLGYSAEELLKMTWADLTYAEDLMPDIEQFNKLLKGEIEDYMLEKRFVRKNGEIVYTNLAVSCVRNDDGSVNYVLALLEDITERKEMEDALKTSEQKFRTLIENATDNIARYDKEARVTYMNPQLEMTLRNSYEVALGKTPTEGRTDVIYDKYETELKKVIATGENAQVYLTLPDVGNGEQYHYIQIVAERDIEGNIIGAIAFGRDVTELTNKTIELQKALEFNEGIINAIPDLMFEVDKDGTYVGVWAQDKELLVAQREILLGKNYKDVLPADVADVARKSMREVDEKGYSLGNTYSLELPGGKKWFELSISKKSSTDTYIVLARDITKRKEAEEAVKELNISLENRVAERTYELQQSLEFTKGVINAIPDLLFEVDREGTYLGIWAQNAELLAAQKEHLLGKKFHDVLSSEATQTALEGIKEADEKGLSFGKTIKIDLSDGEHWFELSTSAKRITDTFLVISRDVTERKKIEDSLRESEEKFRAMVENSPDVIIRYALDGRRTYVNPIGQTLMNKPLEHIIGKIPEEYSALQSTVEFEKAFAKVISEGKEVTIEAPYMMPNGEERWGEQRIVPELDNNGNVVSVLLVGRDSTERKKVESMHQELELLGSALDNTSEAVYLMDDDFSIKYVNEGACKMLGYTQEELTSMKVQDIEVEHSVDEIADIQSKVVQNGEMLFETKHRKKNGDIIDVEILGSTFIFNDTRVSLAVVKDITLKKENDKHIRLLQTAINHGNDALYIVGDDRSILYVNDTACKMLGYSRQEFLSMKIEEIDRYMPTEEIDNVKRSLNDKNEVSFKTKHQAKNKQIFDVEIRVTQFEYDDTTLRLSIVKTI